MASSNERRSQMERRLTELRNPASRNLDRMTALQIVRLMNREDRKVAAAVGRDGRIYALGGIDNVTGQLSSVEAFSL